MAPKKNVLLMVINIGCTSLELNSLEEEPFIDKAKYAIQILIEKKIFLQPKDEIGIITMGNKTDHSEDDNVKFYCEHLLVPNWEMIKYVNNLTATDNFCNWIEALHGALCFIREQVIDPCSIFLVIFNNFKEDAESVNMYDPDVIINDLNYFRNLHILFVGENPLNDESWQTDFALPSEKFALTFMDKVNVQYETINNFIELRRFYVPPPIKSMAWKFNLNFNGINIPCSSYVKITETSKQEPWKMQTINNKDNEDSFTISINPVESKNGNVRNIVKENLKIDLHRNEIKHEKIINGYKFGGKYIPFSEEDEAAMQYTGSTKGMIIYGFVPQNEVKLEYWIGSGCHIIIPTANEDATAFYSLVQAMVCKQYAAIVRKVYNNNRVPKMGVLFPKFDDDNIWCLVHLELPYVSDLRVIKKRPIKSLDKVLNTEKLEALDTFIDSLTIPENKPVYLNMGMFPNVCNQYQWNAIADRALNPEKPLLPLNTYLKKLLEPPDDIKTKAEPHIKKLNQLFNYCKISKHPHKVQKDIIVLNAKNKLENLNQTEINISKDENVLDAKFFTTDDMDIRMEEFEEM